MQCSIFGLYFILPLIFYKRLSDVFDDECQQYLAHFGDEELAREFVKEDHRQALAEGHVPIVRFYISDEYRWIHLRNHPTDSHLGEFVTDAMRKVADLNPTLKGVLDVRDFNERQQGQRTLDDDRLSALIEVISRHRLGLHNAEPDILGRAYEYLLRKFAEGQGQSASEFYTPKEVGWLIAELINPRPRSMVYDPACGSGGLLIKARLLFEDRNPNDRGKAPLLFGREFPHHNRSRHHDTEGLSSIAPFWVLFPSLPADYATPVILEISEKTTKRLEGYIPENSVSNKTGALQQASISDPHRPLLLGNEFQKM